MEIHYGCSYSSDQLGYWGFVMPDHYMLAPEWGGNSTLDTWIALTYLASKTEKIRLGTLVTPIPLRPPAILAKMIATLDIISNGRVVVGIGVGWSQTEFEGYSEWNDPRVRVNKTKEGLELMIKLWLDYDSKSKTDANPINLSRQILPLKKCSTCSKTGTETLSQITIWWNRSPYA